VRSFAEFRLLRVLRAKKLPVPLPFAAYYRREGMHYRAAILMQRLPGVRSLAQLAAAGEAPWDAAGQLIAKFHRAGVDHADLNAHNILFQGSLSQGSEDGADLRGWMIDFDRSRVRIPATGWRNGNLERLQRSLRKRRGSRSVAQVDADFLALRAAYDTAWQRGY
jgi:3-deoxy-D-manno-octulosonic acid kinase